ncbi:unnamed protein product, partial [Nesidiocoris tenuis]
MALESERSPAVEERRTSAFHRIELLTRPERCYPTIVTGVLPRIMSPSTSPTTSPLSQYEYSPPRKMPSPAPPAEQPPTAGRLSFSVDNILRPEFGRQVRRQIPSPLSSPSPSLSSPSPSLSSRKPNDEVPSPTKIDPVIPDDPSGPVWPAWVYCTRYSDRPSSASRDDATADDKTTRDRRLSRTNGAHQREISPGRGPQCLRWRRNTKPHNYLRQINRRNQGQDWKSFVLPWHYRTTRICLCPKLRKSIVCLPQIRRRLTYFSSRPVNRFGGCPRRIFSMGNLPSCFHRGCVAQLSEISNYFDGPINGHGSSDWPKSPKSSRMIGQFAMSRIFCRRSQKGDCGFWATEKSVSIRFCAGKDIEETKGLLIGRMYPKTVEDQFQKFVRQ